MEALLLVDVINTFEHEVPVRSCRASVSGSTGWPPRSTTPYGPAVRSSTSTMRMGTGTAMRRPNVEAAMRGNGADVHDASRAARGQPVPLQAALPGVFDQTPLALVLAELSVDRVLIAGAATEGCVLQTGSRRASTVSR